MKIKTFINGDPLPADDLNNVLSPDVPALGSPTTRYASKLLNVSDTTNFARGRFGLSAPDAAKAMLIQRDGLVVNLIASITVKTAGYVVHNDVRQFALLDEQYRPAEPINFWANGDGGIPMTIFVQPDGTVLVARTGLSPGGNPANFSIYMSHTWVVKP